MSKRKLRSRIPQSRYNLHINLVLAMASKLLASLVIAYFLTLLICLYVIRDWTVGVVLFVVITSLLLSGFMLAFLSRLYFTPIKQLRLGMEKVAEGDFTVQLKTRSNSREIQDIYHGFNLMNRELRATEILKTDFVSNVSHELKTPLSAIEGYAMLLQDCDNLTAEQRGYVDKIVFNTERLSKLTGSMLLLSRLENQLIPTNQSWFCLDEQIRRSVVSLEPAWEKKEIEFDVELDPVEYFGSEGLMNHVWDNLLSNAVKFSPQGGTVTLRLHRHDGGIRFTVDDTGPGIREESMHHIFSKFYQADTSHKQEGNGLGLPLVDKILRLEKGSVRAENLPGGGCRFTVELRNPEKTENN